MSEADTPATGHAKARLSSEQELGSRSLGPGRPNLSPPGPRDLTLCPRCERDLVYPVDWDSAGPHGWSINLRCPECEWTAAGLYSQEVADRFDDALDEATQLLLHDLEALTRANMEQAVERFCAALEADLILPEDF